MKLIHKLLIPILSCAILGTVESSEPAASNGKLVYNKGISGQNTVQGRARFSADVVGLQPQFVCIYFGMNDALNEAQFVALPRFVDNLAWMIDKAEQNQIRPVLCTLHHCVPEGLFKRHQPETYGAEGPNGKIDRYNLAIRELAARKSVPLADFDATTKNLGNGVDWIRPDGVHLTPIGYKLLAEAFWTALEKEGAAGKKIVCFGDSITFGAKMKGAGTAEGDTYPACLSQLASGGK